MNHHSSDAIQRQADRQTASPWRRIAAGGIDYLLVAPWLAVITAVAFVLRQLDVLGTELPRTSGGRIAAQLMVSAVLTVPFTLWLARCEASRNATPGKRLLHLRVDTEGGVLTVRRALLRSAVKVALPWELGHAAIWQTAGRNVTSLTVALVGLAYFVAGAHLVLVFAGGQPIYDRLVGTTVRPARRTRP